MIVILAVSSGQRAVAAIPNPAGIAPTASFTLDGVSITVQTPELPSATFAVTPAGGPTQAAGADRSNPFWSLGLLAIPFGMQSPVLDLPAAQPGGASLYQSLLDAETAKAAGPTTPGPFALLFGIQVQGHVSHIGQRIPGTPGRRPVDRIQWVTEAGGRLWVITEMREVGAPPPTAGAGPFGSGLVITSPDPAQPTTIGATQPAQPAPVPSLAPTSPVTMNARVASLADAPLAGSAVTRAAISVPALPPVTHASTASVSLTGSLPWPHWWSPASSGNCNAGSGPGYLLYTGTGVLSGLQVCAPSSTTLSGACCGNSVQVAFDGDTAWQWQCNELSFRYMDVAWGVPLYWNHNIAPALAAPAADEIADHFPFGAFPNVLEIQNGTVGVAPQPGDVIQMSANPGSVNDPGHTGVVEHVNVDANGNGSITMDTQNGNLTGQETMNVGAPAGKPAWTVGGDGPNYTTAWLHRRTFVHDDLDGDRRSDALAFYDQNQSTNTTGIYEWLTTGSGTTLNYLGATWSSSGFDWTKAKWATGDFNGDGRTDVMALYDLGMPAPYNVPAVGIYEWLNNGANGFTYQGRIWDTLGKGAFEWSSATFAVGDLNGDGKDDVMAFYNQASATTGIYGWLTAGSGNTLSYLGAVWSSSGFDWNQAKWVTGDFNGDGRTDVMALYNLGSPAPYNVPAVGIYEWLNNGANGFAYQFRIWDTLGKGTFDWYSATFAAGDLNGDGKSDALAFYDQNQSTTTTGIYEWLTTGSGSTLNYLGAVWSSSGFDYTLARWAIGDFNGDGKADVMALYNLGMPAPYNVWAVGAREWLNNGTNGFTYQNQIWDTLGKGAFDMSQSIWAS